MADVYSLVCWGGRTGKTVSLSATTDVVTLTNHGLRNGAKLWPSGTLPSELNSSTPVYVRPTASNTFTLHTSSADAIANTGQITFAGSSTYAAVVLKSDLISSVGHSSLAPYGLSDLSRWGSSGSERIYDGIKSWWDARKTVVSFDVEFAELGEAFTETIIATTNLAFASGAFSITSRINEIRSAAFPGGVVDAGYVVSTNSQIGISQANSYVDGFVIRGTVSTSTSFFSLNTSSVGSLCSRMVVTGIGGTSNGIMLSGSGARVEGCLVSGCGNGLRMNTYTYGATVANNTIVGNVTGMSTGGNTGNIIANFINNVVVGNTTNWQPQASGAISASNNVGVAGDAPWVTAGGSQITVDANWNSATPLFMDYAGNDFRLYQSGGIPSANSSLCVDSGAEYYKALNYDIGDRVRPDYMSGAAEYRDIGCFEFDHGYGPHPASHVLTLDNVVVGSRVFIQNQGKTVTHYDQLAAASTVVITATVYGDSRDQWLIKVRKASGSPTYIPYETLMTATPGSSSIYVL